MAKLNAEKELLSNVRFGNCTSMRDTVTISRKMINDPTRFHTCLARIKCGIANLSKSQRMHLFEADSLPSDKLTYPNWF